MFSKSLLAARWTRIIINGAMRSDQMRLQAVPKFLIKFCSCAGFFWLRCTQTGQTEMMKLKNLAPDSASFQPSCFTGRLALAAWFRLRWPGSENGDPDRAESPKISHRDASAFVKSVVRVWADGEMALWLNACVGVYIGL
jgi:hypothetical protein